MATVRRSRTGPLDFQIALQEIDFSFQGDFLDASIFKRKAQELAEPRDDAIGGGHVLMHKFRDGMQGIEEKMRMKLHFQSIQISAG